MANRGYNAKQVSVLVGGLPMTNYAPDTFCEVEYNNDFTELLIGADGEAATSVSNDLSATFTIRVMNTSESNDILQGLATAFKTAKVMFPILVKDLNGRSLHFGAQCFPVRLSPKKAYAKKVEVAEWQFRTDQLVNNVGGNTVFGAGPIL